MQNDTISDAMRALRLTGALFFRVQLRPPYSVTSQGVEEMLKEHAPSPPARAPTR